MLKVVKLNTDHQLIEQSLKNNRKAQKLLYDKYAPKMLSLCVYYIKDIQQSEAVMLSGFFKVFTKLSTFENNGSFEGWIRKIMVWESITYLRKKEVLFFTDEIESYEKLIEEQVELNIAIEDLQQFINQLPEGCKVVFNLYVIEGYKHAEIAEMLKITEGTSKTQLSRARKALQKMISINRKTYHEKTR
ncbi:RNA polymerase sigma factor [Lutibacter sp. HS1-25]|uniref:RNA polymerase sigma factor n=1 Tax=Lutibacter sp. HS1-25 TaxID=2485000 RepID=UPI0026B65558